MGPHSRAGAKVLSAGRRSPGGKGEVTRPPPPKRATRTGGRREGLEGVPILAVILHRYFPVG